MHQGGTRLRHRPGRPSQEHCGPILEEGGGGPAAGQARHSCGEQEHRQGVEIHQPSRPRWEAVDLRNSCSLPVPGRTPGSF